MFCSTIIPTIGRASLARSVSSVLDQRLPADEFEVIVVNDSGRPLAPAGWQTSPRVWQIETRQRGQSVARNAGAALARGRYLHFLDDDDWLLPEALVSFGALAQRAPQADWLYGGLRMLERDGRLLCEYNPGLAGNAHLQLMSGVWVTPVASLIRASAFFAVGGFAPSLRIGEEIDLGRQLTRRGDLAYTAAVVVCVERGHGGHASMANAPSAAEANRWSRDRALAVPGTFGRLRGSASTPYWRGWLLHASGRGPLELAPRTLCRQRQPGRLGHAQPDAGRPSAADPAILAGPARRARPELELTRAQHARPLGGMIMPDSTLAKKLKLKPGQRVALIGAPEGYLKALSPLPEGVVVSEKLSGKFDWMQVFVKSQAEIDKLAPRVVKALKPESLLWISFPKGTSKIQTDLTRDKGWDALHGSNLKWVNLVSVDDTWSAFALRPYREGEARQSFR